MNNTRHSRRRHAWLTLCAAAISVLTFAANPASAQCQYEVTAIIQGPPCWPSNFPAVLRGRGMNSYGHVVGSWQMCLETADEAFYWTPETGLVTMTRPAGVTSAMASDINDHGQIVGGHQVNGVGWKGFVYDIKTQQYTYLEPLHDWPVPVHILSSLNAINNAGIAVGSRVISKPGVSPTISNAVIWDTNTGEVIDLGVVKGLSGEAVDGDNSFSAAGWIGTSEFGADTRAAAWFDMKLEQAGVLPGMTSSRSKHLNCHREVVGLSTPVSGIGLHFFWAQGQMDAILPPGGYDAVGTADYSDTRQMTGHIRVKGTSIVHPFLWQHGEFYNMRELVVNVPEGIVIDLTHIISPTGTILARSGTLAVLLSPVDLPVADLNHDCRVDVHDLLMLLNAWSSQVRVRSQNSPPADINEDGVVDVSDLLILLANWSQLQE